MNIFTVLLYQPLFNLLILFYEYFPGHDFGVAVVLLTVFIRILLYPLMAESLRMQKVTMRIQPQMKEIQEKYKDDKEKQAMLMMQLWKEHKFNPFSSFLFLLVQIPILWTLYQVFFDGFKDGALSMVYGFLPNPGTVNPMFLGSIDLSASYPLFAVAAAILQYFQVKMMMPPQPADSGKERNRSEQFAEMMRVQSIYVMPVFTVLIFWGLPAALGLYWVVSSLFTIGQQYVILKNNR
jgi:YidC/Oxa1 family membrane protein insertase